MPTIACIVTLILYLYKVFLIMKINYFLYPFYILLHVLTKRKKYLGIFAIIIEKTSLNICRYFCMNLKGSFITSIIDRVTPHIKKEGKFADSANRIYFKPSDVPVEELGDNIAEKLKITDDATVAPFADRLIHPDMFGLTPSIRGTKQFVEGSRKLIEQCKDNQIKEKFGKLYPLILDNSKDIYKSTHRMTSLMRSIEQIDNPEIKAEILDKIDFLTKEDSKGFKKFYPSLMSFMEEYADAVNTISGKYSCINNGARKFYKWMDKNDIWLVDIIDGTKKSEECYRKNLLSSKTRHKKYPEYLKNFDEYTKKGYAETFENSIKQDAMKKFFNVYFETRPEAVKRVYSEYLKTVSPDIAAECKEIQKEYNTYVITSNHDTTLKDLEYVKEELKLWKEAGKEEAVMPKIIHVNATDEYMLKSRASGFADMNKDTISVRELLQDDGVATTEGSTLRHEIQHLHDKKAHKPKNSIEEVKEKIRWNYLKLLYGKKWDKELEKGGIKMQAHRKYALSNECELRSVTAETSTEKLSKEYKEEMNKRFDMQNWILKIEDNKVAKRSQLIDKIKHYEEELAEIEKKDK